MKKEVQCDEKKYDYPACGSAYIIIALPMVFLGRSAQFGGSDGEAEALITELDPDYDHGLRR